MPSTETAHLPAANDLSNRSARGEVPLAGAKGQLVDGVHNDVVANVEDARAALTRHA